MKKVERFQKNQRNRTNTASRIRARSYFLSLGSNVGDRKKNLMEAIERLENQKISIKKCSSIYETEPVGIRLQPWFLNVAIEVESFHSPGSLLKLVKGIEEKMGRKPSVLKGPRIIDIDLLLAEESIIKTEKLAIPHPGLTERNFVLIPLEEISPETIVPGIDKSIRVLCGESSDRSAVRSVDSPLKAKKG